MALAVLGVDIQPLQTVLVLAAILAYLVLRGVACQYVAGLIVCTVRPYCVGDHIEEDHDGIVQQVTNVMTTIASYDGRLVHLPNLDVVSQPVVNRRTAGAVRVDIEVRVTWSGDVDELTSAVLEAASSVPLVLPEPAALVMARSSASDRLMLLVRPWHDPFLDCDEVCGSVVTVVSRRLADLGAPHTAIAPPPWRPSASPDV